MDQWKFRNDVVIEVGRLRLNGELAIPIHARGLVIFSHGSGSSRFSPRNRKVARFLNERNIATLLFDLLTELEDATYQNRFDIVMLTERLVGAIKWIRNQELTADYPLGFFGASTGAASAILAATELPEVVALVSRGGRPDLAGPVALSQLQAPTLLIVGGRDTEVIRLNEWAAAQMQCEHQLQIVPGATHLFEEVGTMDTVCELATAWFEKFMVLKYKNND